jgi:hypothetical protein
MNAFNPPVRQSDPWKGADTLDPVEEAWEALRAECEEEFAEWVRADYRNREDADFSNWMVSKARWNRPNKYECALTWLERKLVGRAA